MGQSNFSTLRKYFFKANKLGALSERPLCIPLVNNSYLFSWSVCYIHTLESCAGCNFLSAPTPQNLNPSRTRRNLRNLARSCPADFYPAPAPAPAQPASALFPTQTCTSHRASENHLKVMQRVSPPVVIYSVVHFEANKSFSKNNARKIVKPFNQPRALLSQL